MATDLIRYDLLVQNAFREIFRNVLTDVAGKGLPGEHHFLVTFRTGAPGVKISDRLRQAHPQDMTIVLQHQFWDLAVTDTGFSVGLSFKGVAEKLNVPFAAVTGFFDPSVNFGAEFTVEDAPESAGKRPPPEKTLALASSKGRPTRGRGSEPSEVPGEEPVEAGGKGGRVSKDVVPATETSLAKGADSKPVEVPPAEGPKVVSIDAFRKKT